MTPSIPLLRRKGDLVFLGFFVVNLFFITYIVDLEQLVIDDPARFAYPAWPPPVLVDLVHWWGRRFDPVLLARPVWWKMTIWIDVLFFGPYYVAAIYAFFKGRDWIRVPSFVYAGLMMANVTIIMGEELFGAHATPAPLVVGLANAPWVLFPVALIARLGRSPKPFAEPAHRGSP